MLRLCRRRPPANRTLQKPAAMPAVHKTSARWPAIEPQSQRRRSGPREPSLAMSRDELASQGPLGLIYCLVTGQPGLPGHNCGGNPQNTATCNGCSAFLWAAPTPARVPTTSAATATILEVFLNITFLLFRRKASTFAVSIHSPLTLSLSLLPAFFDDQGQEDDNAASEQQVCQMGLTFPCRRSSQTADEQHDCHSCPDWKGPQSCAKKFIKLFRCFVQALSDTAHWLSALRSF